MTVRRGGVVWLTGLPGAGKSTIAQAVAADLGRRGHLVQVLDGDALRRALGNPGFTRPERERYLRLVAAEAARLEREGMVVVAAVIAPYRAIRAEIRAACRRYFEVYVATPLAVCEARDPKGLYARARRGEIANFTGVGDPYEAPENPDLTIDASRGDPGDAARTVVDRWLASAPVR